MVADIVHHFTVCMIINKDSVSSDISLNNVWLYTVNSSLVRATFMIESGSSTLNTVIAIYTTTKTAFMSAAFVIAMSSAPKVSAAASFSASTRHRS